MKKKYSYLSLTSLFYALVFEVLFSFCPDKCNAQGTFYNNGMPTVSIVSGSTVSILGNYLSKTNSAVDGKIDNQGTLQLTGDWTNNNTTGTPNTFSTSAGTVVFNGTGTQTIGGTNSTTFYNLTFNNDPATAGDVTLATNDYVVSNNITMTRGNVNLNGRTLTLGTGTATPGTLNYTAGFMYSSTGTFTRWISATAAAMGGIASNELGHFPMGTSVGDYRPVWIAYATNLSAGGTVSILHTPNYPAGATPASIVDASWGNTLQGISRSSWTVSTANSFAISGSNDGKIRFGGTGFETFSLADIDASLTTTVVSNYVAATNANTALEVNRTGLTTANLGNTWYVGTKNIVTSPLPVELLAFEAKPNLNTVDVTWQTASEQNCDYFTVERSQDRNNFISAAKIQGAGNSSTLRNYESVDTDPFNGLSYYRLKQTDFNGVSFYSDIVSVQFNSKDIFSMNVYPSVANSISDVNIQLRGKTKSNILILLRDVLGKEYFSKSLLLDNGNYLLAFDNSQQIAPGIYFIIASSNGSFVNKNIVIR